MSEKLTVEAVKAFEAMLKEHEKPLKTLKEETDKLLYLTVSYINNKFKKKVISYNSEKEVFSVIDEKEKVLEILKNIGVVKKE